MSKVVEQWHEVVRNQDAAKLDSLLADNVVFHSPVVHTPQVGKNMTRAYLMAAMKVLNEPGHFVYLREVVQGQHAVLEFQTEIEGVTVNGVDMIEWNDAGQIIDFKVMVRPLKAVNAIHQAMGRILEAFKAGR
jgi:ketosteroid isomerase-like protein